jgi:hypothetical protein
VIDPRALPRFIASNYTEKRIWKQKVCEVKEWPLCIDLVVDDGATVNSVINMLGFAALLTGLRVYHGEGTIKGGGNADRNTNYLLVTGEKIASSRIQDRVAQILPSAKIASLRVKHKQVKQTNVKQQTEEQQQNDEYIMVAKLWHLVQEVRDLELDVSFEPSGIWTQQSSGFEKAVWDFKALGFDAKIYRSAALKHVISVVQQIPVILLPLIKYCHRSHLLQLTYNYTSAGPRLVRQPREATDHQRRSRCNPGARYPCVFHGRLPEGHHTEQAGGRYRPQVWLTSSSDTHALKYS